MRNWLSVSVVVGVVGSFLGGCSNGPGATTVASFCSQKAQLECQYVVPVCESDGLSTTACESARQAACETDAQQATESGTRSFNPNNVQACLNAIQQTYSVLNPGANDELSYSNISGPTGDTTTVNFLCESVFSGNQNANATCTTNYDCTNGNVCTPANGGAKTYVCAPENDVPDQGPCGAAGDVCQSGDACVENPSTGEYLCEPSSETTNGVGAGVVGTPCTSDSQCNPSVAGFCDTYNTGTCQAYYAFGLGYDCELFGGNAPDVRPPPASSSSSSTTSSTSSSTSTSTSTSTSSVQASSSSESHESSESSAASSSEASSSSVGSGSGSSSATSG